jgi:hypothetical protein
MSPNVAFAAQHVPFDAAEYVWIDMKDIPDIPIEEKQKHFDALGVSRDTTLSFRDLRLPFEKFVLIPPAIHYDSGSVVTIERKEEMMTVVGWQLGRDAANFLVEMRPSDDPLDGRDILRIEYNPKLPIAKRGREAAKALYVSSMQTLMSHIQCLCAGAYGTTRETYRCKGDAAVNAKRRSKHKKPFYDWHTVVVETVKTAGNDQGGTHATPRQHEVRGHYVRSKLGKVFWRKSHKRGDPTKGVIFHDYTTGANHEPTERR